MEKDQGTSDRGLRLADRGLSDGQSAIENTKSGTRNPQSSDRIQELMEEYLRLTAAAGSPGPGPAPDVAAACESLRQQVVDGMAPLVESIARRYAGTRTPGSANESLDDLISEGYVGLLTAIEQYRADRGARFCTYATHRINGQILHYLRDRANRRLIRAPSWLQELNSRLRKEEAALEVELGRPATLAELAGRMNLREEAIEELYEHGAGPTVLSLTEESGDDEEWGRSVDLSKIRSQHYVSWQLPVEDHIFLDSLMVRLKDLERKVITLFFFQEFSQTDIARAMDISCNYVGYLLRNGLRKLRKQIEADELRDAQLRVIYAPRRIPGSPSVIDAATGLYNGAYFQNRLTEEVARACRYRHELALIVIRVPLPAEGARALERGGAKGKGQRAKSSRQRVVRNDSEAASPPPAALCSPPPDLLVEGASELEAQEDLCGSTRSVGARNREELLRESGIALRECLRKADIPARIEEGTFAVMLPHTGVGAAAVADRIAQLLSQVAGCPTEAGFALYPADGREPSLLLHAAQERLGAPPLEGAPGGEPPGSGPALPAPAHDVGDGRGTGCPPSGRKPHREVLTKV